MKKLSKKIATCFIAIFMAFTLSSCSGVFALLDIISTLLDPGISLEYTLTQKDLEEFSETVAECEEAGMSEATMIQFAAYMLQMSEQMKHIQTQYRLAYLAYCQDQSDPVAIANYIESEKIMTNARTCSMAMLKKLAIESPIKDELFADWPESEMAMIYADYTKIAELQLANSELTRQFYTLDEKSETWSKDVSEMYEQLVANNQAMAKEYGGEEYYTFISENGYYRKHTVEERNTFRGYVKEYIYPLTKKIKAELDVVEASLTDGQKIAFNALNNDRAYLNGYIDSYRGSLNRKMKAMFEGNSAIFANNENALKGAFVQFLPEYNQPIAYFGPGNYQNNRAVVHENGHFASMFYFDDSTLPFELAETHSQGNEWMYTAYLENLETVEESVAEAYTLTCAFNSMTSILYATMVDEFEEIVYTAEAPIKAEEYAGVINEIIDQYEGCKEFFESAKKRQPFEYIQYVTMDSPGYYLSYATSQIASMSLYAIAQEQGYQAAQNVYVKLQEGIDPTLDFLPSIEAAGLRSPLDESTYQSLENVLLGKKQNA